MLSSSENALGYWEIFNVEIHIDGKKIEATSDGNGPYNIIMKPGKYSVEVKAYSYMDARMDIFVPPQDNNLSLVDVEKVIEGVNRFTFNMFNYWLCYSKHKT